MKLSTVSYQGGKVREMETSLFDRVGSPKIVAQAVRVYLSNQRAGTAKTKTRSEVDLTKAKWFKQKGTGRARHGAKSAPIFVGGGVTHGPHGNGNWKLSMSKTMKRVALKTAFAMQANEERMVVAEGLENASGKTKEMATFIKGLEMKGKAILIITGSTNELMLRAMRNIENVFVTSAENVTTYFVMRAHKILVTPEGLDALTARLAGKEDLKSEVTEKVAKKTAPAKVAKTETVKEVVKKTTVKKAEKKAVVKKKTE